MINLFTLSPLNYEEILSECKAADKSQYIDVLKDCILFAPQKSSLLCPFILDLCNEDATLASTIAQFINLPSSVISSISQLIYAKTLGFKNSKIEVKTLENDYFKEFEIKLENELEMNEYLNYLEIFLEKTKKDMDFTDQKNTNELDLYKMISVILNYQFDIYDCIDELRNFCVAYQDYLAILYLINSSDVNQFYLFNLLLRSMHDQESLVMFFKILLNVNKASRDTLIALVYEYFINRRNYKQNMDIKFLFDTQEEVDQLKRFIDEDTISEMTKYVSIESLNAFVPEYKLVFDFKEIEAIKKDDLILDQEKKEFYKNFCLLGSPSITHFLSYLELYKNEMKMNNEQEKLFLTIFEEIFEQRISFKRIVLNKMKLFGFLKNIN